MKYDSIEALNRAFNVLKNKLGTVEQLVKQQEPIDFFCNLPAGNDGIPAAVAPQAVHLTPIFLPAPIRVKFIELLHFSEFGRRQTQVCLYKGTSLADRKDVPVQWQKMSPIVSKAVGMGVNTTSVYELPKELYLDPKIATYALGFQTSNALTYYGYTPFTSDISDKSSLVTHLCQVDSYGTWPETLTSELLWPVMRVTLFSQYGFKMTGSPFPTETIYRSTQSLFVPITGGGLNFGDVTTFDGLTKCTWIFWLKNASVSANEIYLWYKVNAGGGQFVFRIFGAGTNGIGIQIGTAGINGYVTAITGNNTIDATGWTQVVFVFDGTLTGDANRLKCYTDQTNEALTFTEDAVPAALPASSTSVMQFANNLNGQYTVDVKFDDPAVFAGVALSQANINATISAGRPANLAFNPAGGPSNWLKFEGGVIVDAGSSPWSAPTQSGSITFPEDAPP